MQITVSLDDELVERAQGLTGLVDRSALLEAALVALVARESARRLAKLGGTEPQVKDIPRRRSDPG